MSDTTTAPMTKDQALAWLVHHSPVVVDSYREIGEKVFGWDKTKAWRVIQGWKRLEYVTTETTPNDGRLRIAINPTAIPINVADDGVNDSERSTSSPLPSVSEGRPLPSVAPANERNETVYAHPVATPRAARADALDWMARLVAVGMAVVTAYFSIHGLLTLFPGDEIGVTVFGIGVECLKVVGVMYLSAHARTIWWLWRWAAIAAVIVAASLNSASVYAKFAALHSQAPAASAATREASAAELDARIEAAQIRLDDLKRRSGAIDATVENAGKRGNAKGTTRVVNNTRGDRAALSGNSEAAAKELATLKAERGRVSAAGHRAAAEELPVTLMASLFTTDAATVLRWLVCAVVICGDPAALIMLAAVGSRAKRRVA